MRQVPRWAIVLLVAAVAAPVVVVGQDDAVEYRPERSTYCWPCHQAVVGSSPPLVTFFNLIPPEEAGAAVGTKFEYVVQIQNAWTSDILYLEPTLDITAAPSIAFASDLPPLNLPIIDQVLALAAAGPTDPQRGVTPAPIPVGYTSIRVELKPKNTDTITGPDLTLKVFPDGADTAGEAPYESRTALRGGTESYDFTREDIQAIGYGNWSIVAETTLAESGIPPSQEVEYDVFVTGTADAIDGRIQSVPLGGKIPKGGATSVRFVLVPLAQPADPSTETVKLSVNGWVHYQHQQEAPQDDDNTTKDFAKPIAVEQGQGGAVLRAPQDASTLIIAPSVQNGATMTTISEGIGYLAAFLLIASIWTGGMFGKASRRQLNTVFGSAKRRVAFHNFLSYGIILAAAVHLVLFILELQFYWTVGLIWGGLAILAMLGLGLTGAFQVQMIRKWSYGVWRWTHYGMAVAAILFSVVHGLLDGVHFDAVQDAVGWKDPLDPRGVTG